MSTQENRLYWQLNDNLEYYRKQFLEPKRSTLHFASFLESKVKMNGRILDLACGAGANDIYFKNRWPNINIVGIDINPELFKMADDVSSMMVRGGVTLTAGDWYNLDRELAGKFDGVISLQSLSWMEDWRKALKAVCDLNPRWMAVSSLFYEGEIEYTIKLENHYRQDVNGNPSEVNYNILSLPIVKDFLTNLGYKRFEYAPFDIDIDIPKPDSYDIGTYTLKTEDGRRLQISAALMMPWYFFFASKE